MTLPNDNSNSGYDSSNNVDDGNNNDGGNNINDGNNSDDSNNGTLSIAEYLCLEPATRSQLNSRSTHPLPVCPDVTRSNIHYC